MDLHYNVYKTLEKELCKVNDSLKESKTEGIVDGLDEMKQLIKILLYNWEDDYYMAIATLAALRSKDGRTAVSRLIQSHKMLLLASFVYSVVVVNNFKKKISDIVCTALIMICFE